MSLNNLEANKNKQRTKIQPAKSSALRIESISRFFPASAGDRIPTFPFFKALSRRKLTQSTLGRLREPAESYAKGAWFLGMGRAALRQLKKASYASMWRSVGSGSAPAAVSIAWTWPRWWV
jgi:hypothetical protein